MLRKTVSVDLSFEQIWWLMEEKEPLTPLCDYEQYKCGKYSDDYMFRDADDKLLYNQ